MKYREIKAKIEVLKSEYNTEENKLVLHIKDNNKILFKKRVLVKYVYIDSQREKQKNITKLIREYIEYNYEV